MKQNHIRNDGAISNFIGRCSAVLSHSLIVDWICSVIARIILLFFFLFFLFVICDFVWDIRHVSLSLPYYSPLMVYLSTQSRFKLNAPQSHRDKQKTTSLNRHSAAFLLLLLSWVHFTTVLLDFFLFYFCALSYSLSLLFVSHILHR